MADVPHDLSDGIPLLRSLIHKLSHATNEYWLTRFVLLRLLGFVYVIAFVSLAHQVLPLIGEHGLLPAKHFLQVVSSQGENTLETFLTMPTLFWLDVSDPFLQGCAWVGVVLSLIVFVGFANVPLLFVIWFLYLSFVHIGQVWYGYGWEFLLLETGFLAIFLCPFWDLRPFPKSAPPIPIIWLFRWLSCRIFLGAGLIKLRGDQCWRDLTCLYYHYETQPIPNPLSRHLHFMPTWFHRFGVLWNHVIELIMPVFVFFPRPVRDVVGILLISFQGILILSGNLSFLNYLTIVPALACLDDRFFRRVLPRWVTRKAERAAEQARPSPTQTIYSLIMVMVVAWLSIPVVYNLFSSRQLMNTSFDPLHLVNTYGAFGAVGKERHELIVEGTDETTLTPRTPWKEYEFKAKPGNPFRRLPVVAPYQYRVDWQIWFAAMETPQQNPWLVHLIWKLLVNDPGALSLIAHNPFPNRSPQYIRVQFYRYQFARLDDPTGAVWKRTHLGAWLPPLSRSTPGLKDYIAANGWED